MTGDLYKLFKNFLSLATGQIFVRGLNVIATLYAVRMLGPSEYGVLSSGLALAIVLSFTANLGLGDYLILNVARSPKEVGKLLGDILLAKITFFPLALVGFGLLAITNPQDVAFYALLIGYSLVHSYFQLICAAFRGLERMEYQTLLTMGQTGFVVVSSISAIWLTHNPAFVVLGYLIASALGAVVGYWLLLKNGVRPHYRWEPLRWKTLIQEGLPFGLIFIYGMTHDRLPSIFLPYLASDEVAGWYNSVYNIIVILTTIPGIVMGAFFPFLARKSRDNVDVTTQIITLLVKYTNVISIGLAVGIYVAAPQIVITLFDEAYRPSIGILQILAVGVPFLFLSAILISVLGAVGQQRICARYSGYVLLIAAPLSWLTIKLWGYQSGALAYVFNNILLTAVFIGLAVKKLGKISVGTAFIRPALASVAMIALVWVGRDWPFYVLLPLAGLLYGISLIVSGTLGASEINIARSFLKNRAGQHIV